MWRNVVSTFLTLAIVLLVVPALTYLANRQWVFRAPPPVL